MKLILVFVLLFSLCGCSKREESADIFAMDTIISLKLYGDNSKEVIREMEEEIRRIDNKFSPGAELLEDMEFKYLVDTADSIKDATNGAFNIRLGEVISLWGFYDKNYRVPTDESIKDAMTKPKYDFGGIAKGYAGDKIKALALKRGIKSGILSLGGNVVAIGEKPDGGKWQVGILNPKDSSTYVGYVEVSDRSVITSGSYQRRFVENGEVYHHIINPKTGYPAKSGLLSVTIISKDGTLADALSTACFVLGKEKTMELYNSKKFDFEAILIEDNGNIITTQNANFKGKE